MIQPVLKETPFILDVVAACADKPQRLHLWWLGQSGFLIAWDGRTAAIDLYLSDSLTEKYAGTDKPHVRMSQRVVRPELLAHANLQVVFATHQHTDHLDPQTLTPMFRACPCATLVVPRPLRELAAKRAGMRRLMGVSDGSTGHLGGFTFEAVPAAHPTIETDDRGDLTCVGYIITAGPRRIYHCGDTVVFGGMAERLRPLSVDVAILPINGKIGNMSGRDAARLAKQIGAKLVIPCHYDMFEFNTADPTEQFEPECQAIAQPYRVLRLGERLTLG